MEIELEPTKIVQAIQYPPPAPKPSVPAQTAALALTVALPQNRNRNPKLASMPQGQWAQGPPMGQWNQGMPADGWYQDTPPQWNGNYKWGANTQQLIPGSKCSAPQWGSEPLSQAREREIGNLCIQPPNVKGSKGNQGAAKRNANAGKGKGDGKGAGQQPNLSPQVRH